MVPHQFYILESNITAGTTLPAWTDQMFLHVPFTTYEQTTSTIGLQATARAFGAEMDCTELIHGTNDFPATVRTVCNSYGYGSYNFSMTVEVGPERSTTCISTNCATYHAMPC
jgi:hypothetical protein